MGRARVGGALSIPTLIAPFLAKHSPAPPSYPTIWDWGK